jgi:hypothetical protein
MKDSSGLPGSWKRYRESGTASTSLKIWWRISTGKAKIPTAVDPDGSKDILSNPKPDIVGRWFVSGKLKSKCPILEGAYSKRRDE